MKTRSSLALVAAIALVVAVTPAPSRAAAYTFEIYAGNYDPEPDILDDDTTIGARFGYWFNKRVSVQGTLGLYEIDEEIAEGMTSANIDADITLVDVSVGYRFRADKKRFRPVVFGGIGGAFASIDATVTTPSLIVIVDDLEEDSITAHVGVSPIIHVNRKFYIRG